MESNYTTEQFLENIADIEFTTPRNVEDGNYMLDIWRDLIIFAREIDEDYLTFSAEVDRHIYREPVLV